MARTQRHIVAIGGASFRAKPENLAADRYILRLTGKKRPSVCFVPTASAEPAEVIAAFEDAYGRLGAMTGVLRFFQRTPDLRDTIRSRLLSHLSHESASGIGDVTHYSWQLCTDPRQRASELERELGLVEAEPSLQERAARRARASDSEPVQEG